MINAVCQRIALMLAYALLLGSISTFRTNVRRLYPKNIAKSVRFFEEYRYQQNNWESDVPAGCSTKDGIVRFNLANGGSDLSFVKICYRLSSNTTQVARGYAPMSDETLNSFAIDQYEAGHGGYMSNVVADTSFNMLLGTRAILEANPIQINPLERRFESIDDNITELTDGKFDTCLKFEPQRNNIYLSAISGIFKVAVKLDKPIQAHMYKGLVSKTSSNFDCKQWDLDELAVDFPSLSFPNAWNMDDLILP